MTIHDYYYFSPNGAAVRYTVIPISCHVSTLSSQAHHLVIEWRRALPDNPSALMGLTLPNTIGLRTVQRFHKGSFVFLKNRVWRFSRVPCQRRNLYNVNAHSSWTRNSVANCSYVHMTQTYRQTYWLHSISLLWMILQYDANCMSKSTALSPLHWTLNLFILFR